jgi:methionyl-tRNA formyltransferase
MDASSNSPLTEEKITITIEEKVPKVRIVFMGTPQFAGTILESLLDHHYNIVGVVTQPDKPVGRKQELTISRVKEIATERSLPLLQPDKLDDASVSNIKEWKPDLIIVAAYGKILPANILKIPGFGCINVHASLLPKWRGSSPIHNTLLSGETETGVTIMLMDAGMDTGDILAQETTSIEADETRPELEARLATLGAVRLRHTLPDFIERKITPVKQDDSQATLCQLIDREDGRIFWDTDSQSLYNRYRALTPWPGVFTYWKHDDSLLRLKLITLSHLKQSPQMKRALGEVFEIGDSIGVQTTTGVIILEEVQLEGKERADIRSFVNGYKSFIGSTLQ